MFQVRAGGQILDLQPKQEISLTFDNPFFESDRIPVTLSTPITFPLTAAICRLFRFMPTLLMEPSVKKLSAELLMNGIVICSGTLVFNEYSEDGLSYTFSGAEFEEVASGNLTDILTRFESLLDRYFESGRAKQEGLPTVRQCASELCLSPNYFGDLIKKESGKTAQEHIQLKLIGLAKESVLNPERSISQVAYELGFRYPQHFTRLFKKIVGMTPNEYREKPIA